MSRTSAESDTAGSVVLTPTPAAAHPSTAQIAWTWRYQLWPAMVVAGLFALLGVSGIVLVLVRGPAPAGSTSVTRSGSVAVTNGSYVNALAPFLAPAVGGIAATAAIWYLTPHRRIRRFLQHHPWTRWDATVRPDVRRDGQPDAVRVLITLHGSDGREHRMYAEKIYRRQEYGWTTGDHQVHLAGRPDVRGVVVLTLGDVPSMAYQVPPTVDELRQAHRAAAARDLAPRSRPSSRLQ